MNKLELLQKCKEMGIKGVSSKTKNEILLIIKEHEQETPQENIHVKSNITEHKLTDVLKELIIKTSKDKQRKVCKKCYELGHNITSVFCKINIDKHKILKLKIKNYILSQNCLEDKNIEDYCIELSILLNITPNLCKSLYNEIPLNELLDRQINIDIYFKNINQLLKKCNECNKNILCIQANTHHIWNGNDICDTCWSKYTDYRNIIWEKIKTYKLIQCHVCSSIQTYTSERYHYDHLNMFNKVKSVCSMVNENVNIKEIYDEIDKCQILCLSCHHIVTDIEHKLGFTRIKQTLTRNLNQGEITEEEYNKQTLYYQKIYEEKMKNIYKELKLIGISENHHST
jgi:hypothetical protein